MQTKTFRQTEYEAWTQRASEYDQIFAPISTQAIDDILDNLGPLGGMRHLDVACGTGHLVGAASKRGAASEGIDFSPAMVETARVNYPVERFQTTDAVDLPYADSTFDAVSCAFGLSHMADPQAVVEEIFRVLKPGGCFAFTLWFDAAGGNQVDAILKSALEAHATRAFTLSDQWVQLRFADETTCTAITAQAGFERPAFKKLPILWRARTAQEVVDQLMKLSIRTRAVIELQLPSDQERISEHLLESLESHRSNGVISLAWPALLTVVQKPHREYDLKPPQELEEKHTLYDSLEEILAPETLGKLLSRPVSSVEIQPMTDHGGASGSKLSYVETDAGRYVLKRMAPEFDFIMYATNDQRCRSVRLWQYGLLDELRPHIEHKIIACARDGDGWGILMHDLNEGLFTEDKPISKRLVTVFLDRLARLHARFWNDPRLEDPHIGLIDITARRTSPKLVRGHTGGQRGPIPKFIWEGWEILKTLIEPDVFQILNSLSENPEPLAAVLERYPYTLIHGDYRDANLAYLEPDQAVVYDWHQACRTLMTVDLAWFTSEGYVRNLIGEAGAVRYYRDRLETYLGTSFDDDTWQAMLDLGLLYDTIFRACAFASMSENARKPERRAYAKRLLKERIQQLSDGLRWL